MTDTLHPRITSAAEDLEFLRRRMAQRATAGQAYFGASAAAMARCAAAMADAFLAGATLYVAGDGVHATDAQHNAVEYVHPVLPGCRALPAISLSDDVAATGALAQRPSPEDVYAHQVRVLARRGDILLVLTPLPINQAVARSLDAAKATGMHTVALTWGPGAALQSADQVFHTGTGDPHVAQELHLATYHILWELVHIVLNHRGIAEATT